MSIILFFLTAVNQHKILTNYNCIVVTFPVRGVGDNIIIFLHVLQVNALLYDEKENSLDSEYLAITL